jgi:hypothetical protein
MSKKKNKQHNNSKKTNNNDINKNVDKDIKDIQETTENTNSNNVETKNIETTDIDDNTNDIHDKDNKDNDSEINDNDLEINDNGNNNDSEINNPDDSDIPHMSDFMGNGNDVFTTYKNKYENTMSSAIILLFFGVAGIMSTIGIVSGIIDLPLSTFQNIFLTTLYVIFFVYGIISFFKAMDYKEKISTENTMEDTIDRYLENHITKEYLDSLHDESITEEENYVLYVSTIQETFMKDNPDFDKDLVEYHIDNFLNEHF